MSSLKIPMKASYLKQAGSVQVLLDSVVSLLGHIEDYSVKNELLCTLSAFYHERAAVTVSLVDILMKSSAEGVSVSNDEAALIIQNVIDDLNQNIMDGLVKKHIEAVIVRKHPTLFPAEDS